MVDSWLKPKEQLVLVVWAGNQLLGWFGFGMSLVKKDNSYLTNCPVPSSVIYFGFPTYHQDGRVGELGQTNPSGDRFEHISSRLLGEKMLELNIFPGYCCFSAATNITVMLSLPPLALAASTRDEAVWSKSGFWYS